MPWAISVHAKVMYKINMISPHEKNWVHFSCFFEGYTTSHREKQKTRNCPLAFRSSKDPKIPPGKTSSKKISSRYHPKDIIKTSSLQKSTPISPTVREPSTTPSVCLAQEGGSAERFSR